MRVLHLPTAIGGKAPALAEAERYYGYDSQSLAITNWCGRTADIEIDLSKEKTGFHRVYRLYQTFLDIRSQYDVFHFNFGRTLLHYSPGVKYNPLMGRFLNQLDLAFYPKNTKKVVTFNGSDARLSYSPQAERWLEWIGGGRKYSCPKWRAQKRRAIEKMARYCDHMFGVNPDILRYLPREKSSFLPYAIPSNGIEKMAPSRGDVLRIVHAPTDQEVKGSAFVMAALEKLEDRYPGRVHIDLVEKLPFVEAVELYKKADLVIDQLLLGWYGGFAVETMLMGKPVIAYIAHEDLPVVPDEMAKDLQGALIQANPETLFDVLCRAMEEPEWLDEVADHGYAYAKKWHDPRFVAQLTTARYAP